MKKNNDFIPSTRALKYCPVYFTYMSYFYLIISILKSTLSDSISLYVHTHPPTHTHINIINYLLLIYNSQYNPIISTNGKITKQNYNIQT